MAICSAPYLALACFDSDSVAQSAIPAPEKKQSTAAIQKVVGLLLISLESRCIGGNLLRKLAKAPMAAPGDKFAERNHSN